MKTENQNQPNEDSEIYHGQSLIVGEPLHTYCPSLAEAIGLNEAIVIQQIHFLLCDPRNGSIINGHRWIYNTYEEWQGFFKFWSCKTIARIFVDLEKAGLLVSCQPERGISRRKYYRIPLSARANLSKERFEQAKRDNPKLSCYHDPKLGSSSPQVGAFLNTKKTSKENKASKKTHAPDGASIPPSGGSNGKSKYISSSSSFSSKQAEPIPAEKSPEEEADLDRYVKSGGWEEV